MRSRAARTGLLALVAALALLRPPAVLAEAGGAVDFAHRTVRLVLTTEPPQMDSTRTTDQVSGQLLGLVMEGLTRYDARGRLVPGVAERWEVRADGATFWLREGARWSDGQPVTAHDFVFAWRRVVDPANGSQYAFIMGGIENADAISAGSKPVDSLGVHAVGDHRLEVTFERPVAYFDKLTAFFSFLPIREDFYAATNGRYGADADTLLYDGPFEMTRWDHGARIETRRNPHYWDAADIWLEHVDFPYITADTAAQLNLFKDGRVALAPLDDQTMHDALDRHWRIQSLNSGFLAYIGFNFRDGRPTRNRHLRRALALAFDPFEFVNRVVAIPGNPPATSIFPGWLRYDGRRLRTLIPPPEPRLDVAEARRELALARAELGVDALPPLVLLTDDTPTAQRQAEFLQTLWHDTLGLDVRIDRQIFKQRLAKMTAGDFDLVAAIWGPDYDDPMTFGDLFASWNANNRGRYQSSELDACVRRGQNSVDPAVRIDAFACIQRVLLRDQTIIPAYELGRIYVVDPRVQGFVRRQVGADPDFSRARIVPDAAAPATGG